MESFSCQHCFLTFSSVEEAVDHVHTHRLSEKPCVVPECGQYNRKLTRHVKTSHPSLCRFSCDLCHRVFVKNRALQQHRQDVQDCTMKKKRNRRKKKQARVTSTPSSTSVAGTFHPGYEDAPSYLSLDLSRQFSSTYLANLLHLNKMEISKKSQPTVENAESVDFRSPVTNTDLNRFISDKLQPTEEFNSEMQKTVDKICHFLREHMRPNKIVKGGSLGKGTAIRGRSDIDLVLILNEVKSAEDLKEKLPGIKEEIIKTLRENSRQLSIVPNSISEREFLVKFSVEGLHDNIDVDLLPTFYFEDLKRLYRTMRADTDHVEYYSAALVEQQVEFVKNYSANVKSLIRLVKYWRKTMVVPYEAKRKIPKSYVMELITIHLSEKHNVNGGTFNTLKAFRSIMEELKNYESLNIIWTKNYSRCEIPGAIRTERPLLMDPANPMNNLGSTFVWEEIENAAKQVLESRMMSDVSP